MKFVAAGMIGANLEPPEEDKANTSLAQAVTPATPTNDETLITQQQPVGPPPTFQFTSATTLFAEQGSADPRIPQGTSKDSPIFKAGQLAEGRSYASSSARDLPVFTAPDLGLKEPSTLNLQGYQLVVPSECSVAHVGPTDSHSGVQWRIVGGTVDEERAVELTVSLIDAGQSKDPASTPTWKEVLWQAGVTTSNFRMAYGRINGIAFARCIDKNVRTGAGKGKVRYLTQPTPDFPQRLDIEFATNPDAYGPAYALICEGIVRSITRSDRVMAPTPADLATIASALPSSDAGVFSSDWQLRGPFALAFGDPSNAPASAWEKRGKAWTTSAKFGGDNDVTITIALQSDNNIPANRVRPIALQGPLKSDNIACAFRAEPAYVRLWNNEIFVRIEHLSAQWWADDTFRIVTYHGYLNDYRVDITLTSRSNSSVTIDELQEHVQQTRLATVTEIAENPRKGDWLKQLLSSDEASFKLASGVDLAQAFSVDERGQVALSPNFDPDRQVVVTAYPTLDDPAFLDDYQQWKTPNNAESHLGDAVALKDIKIRPVNGLRDYHRSGQLVWQARTDVGKVGMTLHAEHLRPSDKDMKSPITRHRITDDIQVRLGRRILQTKQEPEITYRELGNLRVWRVSVPAERDKPLADCHYLALIPGKMIVITATYEKNRKDQLDAFDAAVGTLTYLDGAPIEAEAPETTP